MDFGNYDNRKNHSVESLVPDCAKGEPCCLGIDEAGRGPVLGPMVYGTCYCPLSRKEILTTIGFADSKTLTEEQRDGLFEKLNAANNVLGWIINILSPNFISNSMLKRSKYNLNQLSHDTAAGLIQRALDQGVNVSEVYVDTVGDPSSYQSKLKSLFPLLEITVAKKADSIYPIVSAASICAKVARDKALREWKFIEQCTETNDYGSGYPGDPKTKSFLANTLDPVFGFTQFVRFGWSTASLILDKSAVPVSWDDYDDAPKSTNKRKADPKDTSSITCFFQSSNSSGTSVSHPTTHRFFTERCIKHAANL